MRNFSFRVATICTTLLISNQVGAQCSLSITSTPASLNCGGGQVTLQAVSSGGGNFALNNDFNLGNAGTGWTISPAGTFTNPCGPGLDGSTHMWMGSNTAAPRTLQTAPLDVSCGGEICFDFRMSVQGDASPCEGPDLAGEGVYLEWSTDGGATWNTINYFQPNTTGCFNATNNGGGSGCDGDYTAWANYCFPIPPIAQTSTTLFQWWQSGSSGNAFDHWGIDNVTISSLVCSGYYYDWAHIPGFPDDSLITENVTQTTTFSVLYTNGIDDTCYATYTVVVDTTIGVSTTPVAELCAGNNNGSVTTATNGGFAPYTYVLTGPSGSTNTTGSFTSLAPGTYNVAVTDNIGCFGSSTFTVTQGATVASTQNITPETCYLDNNASVQINSNGGSAPYTYVLSGPVSGTNTTGSFNNLSAGNYTVNITDGNGCTASTTFTVNNTPDVVASFTSDYAAGPAPLTVNFTNTSTGATTYNWSFGDGNTSTVVNPSNTYTTDSTFTVILVASNGPCADTTVLTLTTIQSIFFLPNVFSPNGDGVNSSFEFRTLNVKTLNCRIYNRWGTLVAELNSPTAKWDGKDTDGKECPEGVYFYVLELTTVVAPIIYDPNPSQLTGTEFLFNGTVTVLRGK